MPQRREHPSGRNWRRSAGGRAGAVTQGCSGLRGEPAGLAADVWVALRDGAVIPFLHLGLPGARGDCFLL